MRCPPVGKDAEKDRRGEYYQNYGFPLHIRKTHFCGDALKPALGMSGCFFSRSLCDRHLFLNFLQRHALCLRVGKENNEELHDRDYGKEYKWQRFRPLRDLREAE